MPASYFLGNRLLATSHSHPYWDDTMFAARSVAFMCPACGEVWGRIALESGDWLPLLRPCQRHPHPNQGEPGGSFIHPWRIGCPAELPPEVLRYELQLRLDYHESHLK